MSRIRSTLVTPTLVAVALLCPGCDSDAQPKAGNAPLVDGDGDPLPPLVGGSGGGAEVPGNDDPVGGEDPEAAAPETEPENYGAVVPPIPPPAAADLTRHGLAGYEIVTIYSRPDTSSAKLGYLRMGQRVMVTEAIDDEGEGCPKGFHALGTGGFACANKGLLSEADKPPFMHRPPPPPNVETPVPYEYAVIAKEGTPMWWRTADPDEVMLAQQRYDVIAEKEAAQEAKKAAAEAKANPKKKKPPSSSVKPAVGSKADKREKAEGGGDAAVPDADLPGVLETPEGPGAIELTEAEEAEMERKRVAAKKAAEARAAKDEERKAELVRKAARLPLHKQRPFMGRGNIVSRGSTVREKGRSWLRTARGGYVPSANIYGYKPKDFQGAELPEGSDFPFGFVYDEEAVAYKLDGEKLKWAKRLEHKQFVDLEGELVKFGERDYMKTAEGFYIRATSLRIAERQELPEGVKPWERWVDVSLEQQLLVAYDGDTPVYATLISSGKKGNAEESFRTPKGKWRIKSKHISSSMAGSTASDGDYSIQDVPWAMFFDGNYALHGAFWHTRFGRTRSHGCVNLGPTDARWLFYWTTPFVPEQWHGASAHEGSPGSMVVVR